MKFNSEMRGIIHVGANAGQEVQSYVDHDLFPILLFEPNPAHLNDLLEKLSQQVVIAPFALGDKDETRNLWIPKRLDNDGDDDLSASFLRADRSSGYEWGNRDKEGREQSVVVKRFDTLVDSVPFLTHPITRYNTLVVDVQGFEYQVLEGFGEYLSCFKFAQIECSEPPIYEGGKSTSEVAQLLWCFGFSQMSPTVPHGDVFFERKQSEN